jgi:hypothetical protein
MKMVIRGKVSFDFFGSIVAGLAKRQVCQSAGKIIQDCTVFQVPFIGRDDI